jgi:hypothetical protein
MNYSKKYYDKNKNDPAFRQKASENSKKYYDKNKNDPAFRQKKYTDKKNRIETRLKSFVSTTLSAAKSRAKKHNLELNIDTKYLTNLILKCNGKCAATGLNLSAKIGCPFKASIDRINSNKGYVKGNIRVVAAMFNFMKQDYSDKQFAHIAKAFLKNNGL